MSTSIDKFQKLSAIILAGGKSSRMGTCKSELDFHGKSFVQHRIDCLKEDGFEEIFVSGYAGNITGAVYVQDKFGGKGPLDGIYSCLMESGCDEALVISVDLPLMDNQTLNSLIENHSGTITILSHEGIIEPLIGVYNKVLCPQMAEILAGDRTSVKRIFDLEGYNTYNFIGNKKELLNCNTKEEYQKIISSII